MSTAGGWTTTQTRKYYVSMARIEELPSEIVEVHFDDEEVAQALELAQAALEAAEEAMRNGMRARYQNTPNSHMVGKLGEYAVEAWLQNRGVLDSSPFRDPTLTDAPDLVAAGQGVEVKAWSVDGWADWGRCVTPGQLPRIAARAAYIVWVVVSAAEEARFAAIQGWSTPAEVEARPISETGPAQRPVRNRQVPLDQMHPAITLTLV